jgi:hypothetical protein
LARDPQKLVKPMSTFKIGPHVVELSGTGNLRELVAAEFAPVERPDLGDVDLRVVFGAVSRPAGRAVTVGEVAAVTDEAWIDYPSFGWRTQIGTDERGIPLLTVEDANRPGRAPVPVQRLRDWTFLSAAEQNAYLWIHYVLEGFLLVASARVGLVHASAVAVDDRAVMLTSTGGVGKTSTALELIARRGYGFLSDDITPVDAEGNAYFYPRKMMVYPYNLNGTEITFDQIASSGPLDRASWRLRSRLRGPKGVRRRVIPTELFAAGPVGRGVPISKTIYLRRKPTPGIEVVAIDPAELAYRCAAVQVTEFPHTWETLHYWKATAHCPVPPEAVTARQEALFVSAFRASGAESSLEILVPPESTPTKLADVVDEIVRSA